MEHIRIDEHRSMTGTILDGYFELTIRNDGKRTVLNLSMEAAGTLTMLMNRLANTLTIEIEQKTLKAEA